MNPDNLTCAVRVADASQRHDDDSRSAPVCVRTRNWLLYSVALQTGRPHLARMRDFWSSITLITGAYKGVVIGAHLSLSRLDDRHFARWLELFGLALRKQCTPEQVEVFSSRALKMAERIRAARQRSA